MVAAGESDQNCTLLIDLARRHGVYEHPSETAIAIIYNMITIATLPRLKKHCAFIEMEESHRDLRDAGKLSLGRKAALHHGPW
jgi:hypothetical protein